MSIEPVSKYNTTVANNINILNGSSLYDIKHKDLLKDTDVYFTRSIKVVHPYLDNKCGEKIEIAMSSDGLCGFKLIRTLYDDKASIIKNYKLIREKNFTLLQWPAYAISINQLRYTKFKDRIDLTLLDLKKFYEVIKNDTFSVESVKKIIGECELSRAYLNTYTLMWLCSFKSFEDFIDSRKLVFLCDTSDKENYHPLMFVDEKVRKIDDDKLKLYFEELLKVLGHKKRSE